MDRFKPAVMVLFGTTGDLARKKLLPSLYTLFSSGWLDLNTRIVGVGRRPWNQAYYQDVIETAVRASQPVTGEMLADFLDIFSYYQLDMKDNKAYGGLWQHMSDLEKQAGCGANRIFFLATAPDLFPLVADQIGEGQPRREGAFRRLMVEKPFGQDLESARIFNQHLRRHFTEQEIFRIDHYLGKEMLQNILVLRFGNQIFEPAWNRNHIDHVQITISETIGIEQRGGYYDRSGALRDMVQNHILQLLALLTMDRPESFDSEGLRDGKVALFHSIRPFSQDNLAETVVLGQYESGAQGESAYLEEKGVASDSRTETFAAIRFQIDHSRWQGVPFFVRTGKRMSQRQAQITVVYKDQEYGPLHRPVDPNILVIRIQPTEGVDLRYNIKQPGTGLNVIPVEMNFCQTCHFPGQSAEAYVKLLMDAWNGDLNLFTRWDEIEATWSLIDSLRRQQDHIPLELYPAGQDGPAAADRLIRQTGRSWLDL